MSKKKKKDISDTLRQGIQSILIEAGIDPNDSEAVKAYMLELIKTLQDFRHLFNNSTVDTTVDLLEQLYVLLKDK